MWQITHIRRALIDTRNGKLSLSIHLPNATRESRQSHDDHGCPARQPVQNGQKIKYITSTSYIPNRRTIYVTGVSHWLWRTFLFHYYLKTRSRRFMAEILPIHRNTLFQSINHIWKWQHFSDQTHTYALYVCLHFPLHLGIMILSLLYDEFMVHLHHYSAKQEWFVQR